MNGGFSEGHWIKYQPVIAIETLWSQ